VSAAGRGLTALVLVVAAGMAAALAFAAATGMPAGELLHLVSYLTPAAVATLAVALAARPFLERLPARLAVVVVGAAAAVAAVANVAVLAWLMFLDTDDAVHVGALVLYAVAVGVAAGLALARESQVALDRLTTTARALSEGDLRARAGRVGGARELRLLAATLDEMADRLAGALERERELEARRRDLVAAASHDLRTPLASLKVMIHAVEDGVVEDPSDLRRYAGEMRRAVDALVGLVDDLFQLAQLDAVALEREAGLTTVAEVVDDAVAAVRTAAAQKGVKVDVELAAGDATCSPRLARVLQNLLTNAVRHTPAGGTVTVRAAYVGERLELSVADTGEGIDPALLERVFEPFWRADPARGGPGAGLGLTLAQRIVEALGGRIEAQAEPARGARFAVVLPSAR
jgi:signal transduction histidine kinase